MAINTIEFANWINAYLEIDKFQDYSPNGLQVEANAEIKKIVFGVSASLELIEKAIQLNSDALVVHHGYFWKNEKQTLTGIKAARIKALMQNNISLLGYHLPLDAHKEIGNNIQLAKVLNIKNPEPINESLIWKGDLENQIDLSHFSDLIEQKLNRKPLVIESNQKPIKKVAWCTGAAQDLLEYLIEENINVDAYISGEVSERTTLLSRESKINYISAGHHATERYGIKALCKKIQQEFNLDCQFIDIDNPA